MKGPKPKLDNVVPMKGGMPDAVPEPPVLMTEVAADVWAELAPHLVAKQRLDVTYRYQFASYCEAVANFIRATNDVALNGMFYEVKTRNGLQQKKTAAWSSQQEAMNQMRRDSALFGLSPVDNARMTDGGQGDLFDQIMKGLKGAST